MLAEFKTKKSPQTYVTSMPTTTTIPTSTCTTTTSSSSPSVSVETIQTKKLPKVEKVVDEKPQKKESAVPQAKVSTTTNTSTSTTKSESFAFPAYNRDNLFKLLQAL